MKEVTYTDKRGRKFYTMIPNDAPPSEAQHGVLIGPPSLENLKLPVALEVALNNQLHARRILTAADAKHRRQELFAAWQAALRVDTDILLAEYVNQEAGNNAR